VSTEACARSDQEGIGVMLPGERQDFVQDVVIVLHLPPRPLSRGFPFGVPAFGVDAIYTEYLELALIQLLAKGGDHARVFPLEETAHGSWKNQDPSASMTKNQQLHVSL